MINATDLEIPERDLALETRETPARPKRESPELRALREEAAGLRGDLESLQGAIEVARNVKPHGSELHCARCFNSGRDAVLQTIDGSRKPEPRKK